MLWHAILYDIILIKFNLLFNSNNLRLVFIFSELPLQ